MTSNHTETKQTKTDILANDQQEDKVPNAWVKQWIYTHPIQMNHTKHINKAMAFVVMKYVKATSSNLL